MVSGDFNGDGRIDLAVVNQFDNSVSVQLGKSDGTFQTQVTAAVGAMLRNRGHRPQIGRPVDRDGGVVGHADRREPSRSRKKSGGPQGPHWSEAETAR